MLHIFAPKIGGTGVMCYCGRKGTFFIRANDRETLGKECSKFEDIDYVDRKPYKETDTYALYGGKAYFNPYANGFCPNEDVDKYARAE